MKKIAIAIFTMTVSLQAFAVSVSFTPQPTTAPALRDRAATVVRSAMLKSGQLQQRIEIGYTCVLDGKRLNPGVNGLFDQSNSASIDVWAVDLQGAAELALTPYVVVQSNPDANLVRIKFDEAIYDIATVTCKPNGRRQAAN